ncbi:MAG: hypothetical protein ACREBS_02540 [Nitrososphaerales archaeon]
MSIDFDPEVLGSVFKDLSSFGVGISDIVSCYPDHEEKLKHEDYKSESD